MTSCPLHDNCENELNELARSYGYRSAQDFVANRGVDALAEATLQQLKERAGTFNSTSFHDKPQRDDPSVTNTFFNAGKRDDDKHGHVKYRDNPDGTTDYLYARDVEGNEYDV